MLRYEEPFSLSQSTDKYSSSRYSFPKARRFSLSEKTSPPYYSVKDSFKHNALSCTMGKGDKRYISLSQIKKAKEMPPPNKYHIRWVKSNLLGKFGKDDRFRLKERQIPGPGTYESAKSVTHKVTLKRRLVQREKERSPGPKYLSRDPFQNRCWQITLKSRLQGPKQQQTPSPCKYVIPQWPDSRSFSYSK